MDGEHIRRCFVDSRIGAQADCGCKAVRYRGHADWFEICETHKTVAPKEYLERREKLLEAAADEVSRCEEPGGLKAEHRGKRRMTVIHLNCPHCGKNVETQEVVRCPYCVSRDEFMPMIDHAERGFRCQECGHVSMPKERAFRCSCGKCLKLRDYRRSASA